MSDTNTVEAIITNLETILAGLGLNFESLPVDGIQTTPMSVLEYDTEEFDDGFQERPYYNTVNFTAKIRAKSTTANADRDTKRTWIHLVKDAVTVAALNVGDLSASKLVARVEHNGAVTGTDGEAVTVDYDLGIKYRVS